MKANRDEKLSLGHLASSVLKAYHLLSYLSHVFQKDKVEVNLKTNLQADKSTETNTDTRTETQLFMRTANRLATSKASKTGTGKSFRQKVVIRTQIWLAKKHRFYNHFRKNPRSQTSEKWIAAREENGLIEEFLWMLVDPNRVSYPELLAEEPDRVDAHIKSQLMREFKQLNENHKANGKS